MTDAGKKLREELEPIARIAQELRRAEAENRMLREALKSIRFFVGKSKAKGTGKLKLSSVVDLCDEYAARALSIGGPNV